MELITSIVETVVVAAVGYLVVRTINSRIEGLERRMDRHEARDEARWDALERRFSGHEARNEARWDALERRFSGHDSRFDRLQGSIDGLRSDVTQLVISWGAPPPKAENG